MVFLLQKTLYVLYSVSISDVCKEGVSVREVTGPYLRPVGLDKPASHRQYVTGTFVGYVWLNGSKETIYKGIVNNHHKASCDLEVLCCV